MHIMTQVYYIIMYNISSCVYFSSTKPNQARVLLLSEEFKTIVAKMHRVYKDIYNT